MPRLHFRTKHVLPRIKPSRDSTKNIYRLLQKSSKRSKGKHHYHHDRERFSILNSVMQLVTGLLAHKERERGIHHRQQLLSQNDPTVRPTVKIEVKQEPTGSGLRRSRRLSHLRKRHR